MGTQLLSQFSLLTDSRPIFMFVLTLIFETNVLFWVQTHFHSQEELLGFHVCKLINRPSVGISANLAWLSSALVCDM